MSNLNSIDRVRHTQAVHIYVHMFILNPSLFIPKNSFQAQNPKTPNPIPPQINNQKLQKTNLSGTNCLTPFISMKQREIFHCSYSPVYRGTNALLIKSSRPTAKSSTVMKSTLVQISVMKYSYHLCPCTCSRASKSRKTYSHSCILVICCQALLYQSVEGTQTSPSFHVKYKIQLS